MSRLIAGIRKRAAAYIFAEQAGDAECTIHLHSRCSYPLELHYDVMERYLEEQGTEKTLLIYLTRMWDCKGSNWGPSTSENSQQRALKLHLQLMKMLKDIVRKNLQNGYFWVWIWNVIENSVSKSGFWWFMVHHLVVHWSSIISRLSALVPSLLFDASETIATKLSPKHIITDSCRVIYEQFQLFFSFYLSGTEIQTKFVWPWKQQIRNPKLLSSCRSI